MKRLSKINNVKGLRVFISVVFALALSIPSTALSVLANSRTAYAQDNGTVWLSVGNYYSYFGMLDRPITIDGATTAYCANPIKLAPPDGSYQTSAIVPLSSERTVDEIYRDLYYGFGGPGFDPSMWPDTCNGDAWTDNYYRACTHVLIADKMGDINSALAGTSQSFKNWAYKWLDGWNYDDKGAYNPNAVGEKFRTASLPDGFGDACFAINVGQATQMIVGYKPFGYIELNKSSANTSITDGNNCYSLEGAAYGVYGDSACSKQVTTLTTNKNGYAKSSGLPQGKYYVKEITPSKSYSLDLKTYEVTVYSDATSSIFSLETPQNDPVNILVGKIDRETTTEYKLNGATFEGAQFEVKYFDNLDGDSSGTPVRTWVYETQENGKIVPLTQTPISGDQTYKNSLGYTVFPIGTYTIQEIKAPTGYLVNDKIETRVITSDNSVDEHVETYNHIMTPEQVKRGDLSFSKKFSNTGERGKDIPFLLTSKSTGESHVVMTDENGEFNSADVAHSTNTNGNDAVLRVATDTDERIIEIDGTKYVVDEDKLTTESGTWFGMNANGTKAPVDDDLCAFPFDTEAFQDGGYTLQELPCKANEGYKLITATVNIRTDNKLVDYGTLDDSLESKITISKVDATSSEEIEGATLQLEKKNDAGSWEKVEEWVSTKEPHVVVGKEGTTYRLIETLAPKDYEQCELIEFTVRDGEVLKDVVMKDEPIEISGSIDKRENVLYEIDENGDYIYTLDYRSTSSTWGDEMNMWDMIDCAVDGKSYLQYVNTPVVSGDYDETMNVWYKTNKSDATYDIDAKTYNACETNPENPHNKSNERVHDFTSWKLWKQRVSTISSETLKVEDLKLAEGEVVTGVAFEHGRVEKDAGSAAANSNQWYRNYLKDKSDFIDSENDAYCEKNVGEDGIVRVKHFDTFTSNDNKEVAYQPAVFGMKATEDTLKEGGVELWNSANMDIHRNLAPDYPKLNDDDEDKVVQTTPKIGTTLVDRSTQTHESYPSKNTTLVDTVEYTGLIPGKEYKITGKLMDKSTSKPLLSNDNEVTSSITFTPEKANGKVDLEFTFDSSSMLDKTTVAYEDLHRNDTNIYSEHNIDNPDQTVTFKKTPTTKKTGGYYDKTGQNLKLALALLGIGMTVVTAATGVYFTRKSGFFHKAK